MDKPVLLYHGSCNGIEGPLTPRENYGDLNGHFPDGPQALVFATDNKAMAALYSLKTSHMLSAGSTQGINFGFFADYDAWRKQLDASSCQLYTLPGHSFEPTLNDKGQWSGEWKSRSVVQPLAAERCTPESVMGQGMQLFFLSDHIPRDAWQSHPDSPQAAFSARIQAKYKSGVLPRECTPLHIATELVEQGIMRHLNAETGINPLPLEKSPHAHIIEQDVAMLWWEMEKNRPEPAKLLWSAMPRNQRGHRANIQLDGKP